MDLVADLPPDMTLDEKDSESITLGKRSSVEEAALLSSSRKKSPGFKSDKHLNKRRRTFPKLQSLYSFFQSNLFQKSEHVQSATSVDPAGRDAKESEIFETISVNESTKSKWLNENDPLSDYSGKNAFATLLASQKSRSRRNQQWFHLEEAVAGRSCCKWTQQACGNGTEILWKCDMEFKHGSGEGSTTLHITTNVPSNSGGHFVSWENSKLMSNTNVKIRKRFSPSLLKSSLQKNIRLCRSGPAIRVAVHLIKEHGLIEFLRRLSIIAVEDVLLHPEMPLLMWLTAATSKGFNPSPQQISNCLRIVHELSSARWRDPDFSTGETWIPPLQLHQVDACLAPEKAILIKCLLLRASFGGTFGDVDFLKRCASIWFKRFTDGSAPPSAVREAAFAQKDGFEESEELMATSRDWVIILQSVYSQLPETPYASGPTLSNLPKHCGNVGNVLQSVDVAAVGSLLLSDVPYSAVDFHCSRIVEDLLEDPNMQERIGDLVRQYPGLQCDLQQHVKDAIWLFRSSINKKQALFVAETDPAEDGERPFLLPLWRALEDWARDYSRKHINSRFQVH